MGALRRGTRTLEGWLKALQNDLRTPIAKPATQELRILAGAIEQLAAHLADARERERSLERRLAQGERLSALGRVVAGVAHELRNPLAGIKLGLDLLDREGRLDPVGKADVENARSEVGRLDRLVTQLLSAAKNTPRTPIQTELAALITRRVLVAQTLARERGVTLRSTGDARARFDQDLISAALDNLLRNAIEATPAGGAVEVECAADDARVWIDVTDEGRGVAADQEGRLFEPFFTTKKEGTGLGLWLSRTAVEASGGHLSYTRANGRTRMRIELPRAPA
jgi:signal transduction histidine kinase